MLLLEEASMMIAGLDLPPEAAWRHIGLSEEEIDEALAEGFGRDREETEATDTDVSEPTPTE
jgi:hypothetical protein